MTRLERLAAALAVVTTRGSVTMSIASLELRNPLNGRGLGVSRGARMASNARRQRERRVGAKLARCLATPGGPIMSMPHICVVLARISPKAFDSDNNEAALKSVRDGMAEAWGIDDADPRVTWVCDWRKGPAHLVEAALWVVPERTAIPERTPAPSQPEIDADDYNGRPRVVVHGGLIQRREVRRDAWADIRSDSRKPLALSPSLIRAKGGA